MKPCKHHRIDLKQNKCFRKSKSILLSGCLIYNRGWFGLLSCTHLCGWTLAYLNSNKQRQSSICPSNKRHRLDFADQSRLQLTSHVHLACPLFSPLSSGNKLSPLVPTLGMWPSWSQSVKCNILLTLVTNCFRNVHVMNTGRPHQNPAFSSLYECF